MKEIPLTQGMVALVDDEDYEGLMKWKWCCLVGGRRYYAVRNISLPDGKQRIIYMHRIVLDTPLGYETDHVNGNGLDNRKENLRIATTSQNHCNRSKQQDNTSGYKGVSWCKDKKKWRAQIRINKKHIHIGLFMNKLEAVLAYNVAATKLHGEFARPNQIGKI